MIKIGVVGVGIAGYHAAERWGWEGKTEVKGRASEVS